MAKYTTISTVRHAETTYGEEKRYAGTVDVPLSEAGVRDATQASKSIQRKKFDVVITSAMKRCIQTADLLVGDKFPRVRNKLCNERVYGELEGLTWEETQKVTPKILFVKVGDDTHSVNPRGAEPFEALRVRADKFRRYIFQRYEGKKLLVVSHAVFLQQFHGALRGMSCIESLAISVSKLQFTTFRMNGMKFVSEKSVKLSKLHMPDW